MRPKRLGTGQKQTHGGFSGHAVDGAETLGWAVERVGCAEDMTAQRSLKMLCLDTGRVCAAVVGAAAGVVGTVVWTVVGEALP